MEVHERVQGFREQLAADRARLDDRAYQVQQLQETITDLRNETTLLAKVDEVLLHISSKVLGRSTEKIDTLVTYGLRSVFEGQDLRFSTEIDRFRGKTSVRFKLTHGGVEAPLAESFGGGPLVVAGVLLRVVAIMVLDLQRVILLDESLAFVSDEYTEAASRLLRKLCQDLDFKILMVTHNPKFAEHADRHYAARKTPDGTKFDLVRDRPESGE